jgi:site-specific DNA-methyltransferase (adenine-specific)
MGSGSTGKAAMREGFRFIGIDMTPEYVEIARARIDYELSRVELLVTEAAKQPDLFADQAA